MMQKRPTLGRGLADLLGQSAAGRIASAAAADAAPKGEELAKLPLDLLQRGRYQPRADLRQETLEELANSIRVQGVIPVSYTHLPQKRPVLLLKLAHGGKFTTENVSCLLYTSRCV